MDDQNSNYGCGVLGSLGGRNCDKDENHLNFLVETIKCYGVSFGVWMKKTKMKVEKYVEYMTLHLLWVTI